MKLLEILAIVLNLLGGLAFAKGLFISNKKAIKLGVSRLSGDTDEENIKLPAVQDRIQQRKWGIIGAILLLLGAAAQFLTIYPVTAHYFPKSKAVIFSNFIPTLTNNKIELAEVIALFALIVSYLAYRKSKDKFFTKENINLLGYQAVFLTNDHIYFGKITEADKDFIKLTRIYYLQPGADQKTAQMQDLVKLGNELHAPEDAMFILRSHLLFWENLKESSPVVQAIRNFERNDH